MAESTTNTGPGQNPAPGQKTGVAQELAGKAKATAEQTRQRITERFGDGKSSVTREARGVAQALRKTAEHCEEQEQTTVANYARRAADGVERLTDVLERKNLSDMLTDLERLSRERPVVVGAVALLAGFLGARVARTAVSARREHSGEAGECVASEQEPSGSEGFASEESAVTVDVIEPIQGGF